MSKPLVWISVILGIIFVALAATYLFVPAGSLPAILPGHVVGSSQIHFKHAFGSLIVALALFAFAWFQSGTDRT
jgi:hypothetical protein